MIGFVVIFAGIVLIAQNCGSSNVGQPDQEIVPHTIDHGGDGDEHIGSGFPARSGAAVLCPECGKDGPHFPIVYENVDLWQCNECAHWWPVD